MDTGTKSEGALPSVAQKGGPLPRSRSLGSMGVWGVVVVSRGTVAGLGLVETLPLSLWSITRGSAGGPGHPVS